MKVIELKTAMDGGFAEVRADITEVKADIVVMKADIAELKADVVEIKEDIVLMKADIVTLDKRVTSEGITTRRHFDVVAEGLRSDMKLIAEAAMATANALERSTAEMRSEHATFISVLENHEIRLTALERVQ